MTVVWVEEVGSTNTEAAEQARLGVPHGWAVAARRQRTGRGRLGRTWEEAPGNLFLSVVLRPTLAPDALPWVTLGAGVVVAEVLGDPFRLKWPNDVLDAEGRKVAGVLCEAEWLHGALQAIVVGIGVNVAHAPADVHATSLHAHGHDTDLAVLAERLRVGLASLDVSTVPARWRALSCT
ncbi:MAG: biotin--[acetyl-CoA-carboxylase] ligase, partial [Myxococcales bacterium]|nr:biotin--[acetyl-CoA-carboxylase] ligase [Myxococcales bacterium]